MLLSEVRLRNCLKSLASLKTNASKPTKQSKEGSFRCDMTAIPALETLLSDFLDSFYEYFIDGPPANRPSANFRVAQYGEVPLIGLPRSAVKLRRSPAAWKRAYPSDSGRFFASFGRNSLWGLL